MKHARIVLFLSILLLLVSPETEARGSRKGLPNMDRLTKKLEMLVEEYYPEARFSTDKNRIEFDTDTRNFVVHEKRKRGDWGLPRNIVGPRAALPGNGRNRHGGIVGRISLFPGRYVMQTTRPQTEDYRYFKTLRLGPESATYDCHLVADLRYPETVDPAFLEKYTALIKGFERYLK